MRERRVLRFAVEALFLGALAAALTIADLRAPAIAGLMLVGWLVVALYEWVATREQPHYGRGLPPRYYVPQVSLPPPRPLEQLRSGYPAAELRDEAPTWIASASLRAEVLAEWPVAAAPSPAVGEDTVADLPAVEIADEPLAEMPLDLEAAEEEVAPEKEPVAVVVAEPEVVAEAELVAEPEVVEEPEVVAVAEEAKAEPEVVPEAKAGRETRSRRAAGARRRGGGRRERPAFDKAEIVEEAEVAAEPAAVVHEPEVARAEESEAASPPLEQEPAPVPERLARHSFDPLGQTAPTRRRLRRRSGDDDGVAEVPARPPRPVVLPGRSRRED